MADLLSTGISGLLAYRSALDTVGNNIANANTPGYSRQRVELVARTPTGSGAGFIGNGVDIATVRRLGDALIATRLQSDASASGRLEVFAGYASRIDSLLSDADAGLSRPLQGFFDAANALTQNPGSVAARQSLIGSADTLAARFRDTQSQLDLMDREVNQRLQFTVEEINGLTESLARLNGEIASGYAQFGGQPPNDLLDRRDQLLQDLSARVGISTVAQEDGTISVYTGSGQTLVLGRQNTALSVTQDSYNSGRLDVVYGGSTRITAQIGGGSLGGLLDVRREVIDPARSELGRLAVGIAAAVNAQHAQGTDQYGDAGGLFFAEPQGAAFASTANTGSAKVAVGFGDPAALGTGEFQLRYDGAAWTMSHARTGQSVAFAGTGTAGDPLRGAGLALVVDGAPAAGDSFLIRPTAFAAAGLSVAIGDPGRVAAAGPGAVPNSGDNSNAQALAQLGGQGLFNGGSTSILQGHAGLVAQAGLGAHQASLRLDAQRAIGAQTFAEREAAAGVNLDEEAADLIRYQQAYQAAARVIQVADTLFQTLLQAAGR